MEPSRLLRDHPLLSLTTTQGLLLWAGLKVQWSLRCWAKYQKRMIVLDEFIAGWAGGGGVAALARGSEHVLLKAGSIQICGNHGRMVQ